jgi:hypothetical protein
MRRTEKCALFSAGGGAPDGKSRWLISKAATGFAARAQGRKMRFLFSRVAWRGRNTALEQAAHFKSGSWLHCARAGQKNHSQELRDKNTACTLP